MSVQTQNPLEAFQWKQQPQAERIVRELVDGFLSRSTWAAALSARMRDETGTRFIDWVDHIASPRSPAIEQRLRAAGFAPDARKGAAHCMVNAGGVFPPVLLDDSPILRIAIKVGSVADCAAALGIDRPIEGPPLGRYRRIMLAEENGTELWADERHGYRGFEIPRHDLLMAVSSQHHLERFRTRRRDCAEDAEGFAHAKDLIEAAISDLGRDLSCDVFFAAERDFWQRRNRAGQVQKARQDRLGLGWANHDHHTYRASRRNFAALVRIWELLGFEIRERFYAGREAGWGAQVMEQPITGITTFNDVDLSPEELMGDFSHDGLPPREDGKLGTVGLWCALHGDSFLQAGMHHLEAQFDFDALRNQLENEGVKIMKPFTNFNYLRQAFTEGERWPVKENRIARLLDRGAITPEQADEFRANGAIGSHLENLERNEGFKGFNQTGVSEIIAATDPRKHTGKLGA